jgi:hypothetical protein
MRSVVAQELIDFVIAAHRGCWGIAAADRSYSIPNFRHGFSVDPVNKNGAARF